MTVQELEQPLPSALPGTLQRIPPSHPNRCSVADYNPATSPEVNCSDSSGDRGDVETANAKSDNEDRTDVPDGGPRALETLKFSFKSLWDISKEDIHPDLVADHGKPFYPEGSRGRADFTSIDFNTHYWAARYAHECWVLYDPSEQAFYKYNGSSGIWLREQNEKLRDDIARFLLRYSRSLGEDTLMIKRSPARLGEMLNMLKVFAQRFPEFPKRDARSLHLRSGMLLLDSSPPVLRPFSPLDYSKFQCPIPYDSTAQCPRFLGELVLPVMSAQDAKMLQHFCGLFLLGRNIFQMFLILRGPGKCGKGTIVSIIKSILGGNDNVKPLRTSHLGGRFELDDLDKASLLIGSDVDPDFLSTPGASVIKALTGGDVLTSEKKGGSKKVVNGQQNIIITTNSRLRVNLQGDQTAWKRRMRIIQFDQPVERAIADFDKILIEQEGSGILNWFIEGAIEVAAWANNGGQFPVTVEQMARVDDLLDASDSLRLFVETRTQRQPGSDVTSEELFDAYENFCAQKHWKATSKGRVFDELPGLMEKIYKRPRRNDIKRDGGTRRGYMDVSLVSSLAASVVPSS